MKREYYIRPACGDKRGCNYRGTCCGKSKAASRKRKRTGLRCGKNCAYYPEYRLVDYAMDVPRWMSCPGGVVGLQVDV